VTFNDPQLQNYDVASIPRPDDFDTFAQERDHRWDSSASRRYVSEEVIGYEDLDENGSWDDAPEYGHVWYPTTVAVGWAPYHYGHWGWVGAYGWSWIDDASWGFAPFHYGRWVSVSGRWGWCPGRIDVRPVYAPALVAFVGGRIGGVNVSIGIGEPIGWFPLGWGEPYIPSYHVSRQYFTNVNVSNTVINNTVINNYYGNYSAGNVNYNQITYANRNINGAVTAVPVAAFVSAKPVATAAVAVNHETFANARVNGFAAVAPTRASLAPQVAARAVPTSAVLNRPIVAATKPPAPVASFAARQAMLAKDPGKPLPQQQLHATAAVAGGPATTVRPNMKLVTQGAPVHSEAPKLPVKTGAAAAANANMRANPAGNNAQINANAQHNERAGGADIRHPLNPGAQHTQTMTGQTPTGTVGRQNQPHVDSARFAHPNAADQTKAAGNAVNGQPQPQSERRATGNANAGQGTGNAAALNHQQYNQAAPKTQVQEYHKPNAAAPTQEYNRTTQSQPQSHEYHKPVQTQQAVQTQQPMQAQPYHAQEHQVQQHQVQQQHVQQINHAQPVQQAPQPRVVPQQQPHPQQQQQPVHDKKKDKDDDNKHGGR